MARADGLDRLRSGRFDSRLQAGPALSVTPPRLNAAAAPVSTIYPCKARAPFLEPREAHADLPDGARTPPAGSGFLGMMGLEANLAAILQDASSILSSLAASLLRSHRDRA